MVKPQPRSRCTRRQRRASVRARVPFTGSSAVAYTYGRKRSRRPCSASSAGRMNSSKLTMEATGLPGTPKTSVPSRTPKARGLPGFVATPQKRRSTPSSSCTCLTKSYSPTETPPDVMTTSLSRAASMSRRVSSRSSRAIPSTTGSPPACVTCPAAVKEFELWICPGPSGLPSGTSSLPVARIATRGRLATDTSSTPMEASRPISAGPSRAPRGMTRSPGATSSAARRTLAPVGGACRTRSRSPVCSVCSTCTTVSAPAGSGAPVMIFAA